MEKALILTGFMGSGKSAVAKLAARTLGVPVLDLDDLIVERAGKTISRIFAEEGEAGFREQETALLREVAGRMDIVVATGGGVLSTPENRSILEGATVVNLDADFATLLGRLHGSEDLRPLLKQGPEKLLKLFENRKPYYEAVRLHVDTDGKDVSQVAEEVVNLYRSSAGGKE